MTSVMVVSGIGGLNELNKATKFLTDKNEKSDIERKFKVANRFFNLIRTLGVFLIMIGIYPFSQLDTADPVAIENDMNNPDKRVLAWWGSMQYGLCLRLMALSNPEKFWDLAVHMGTSVILPAQTVAASLLVAGTVKSISDPYDWKRIVVTLTNAGAFAVDTFNQFTNLLPAGFTNLNTASAAWLSYGYELRAHLMMGLHVVGIFAPPNETLKDHKS